MQTEKIKRPDLLSALCILSFVGSGLAFIGYFLASLFFEKTSELIIKYSNWHTVEAISPLYFTVIMALSAGSLIGAIRIWKRHKDGFYLYIFAQLAIMFLPVIWINWAAFSNTNVIFTGIFFIGYGINFKHFK